MASQNRHGFIQKCWCKKQIGTLKKKSQVDALTGEVHIEPNQVEIIFNKGKYLKGEKIYLLTTEGEGIYKAWYKGKIESIEALDLFDNSGNPKKCLVPSEKCWGLASLSISDQKKTWWIKVKTPLGKIGWSDQSEHFSGNDSCN